MEVYGITDDNEQTPVTEFSAELELFTALNRLGRAVELYYYPTNSTNRTLDWYSFWLLESEREKPADDLYAMYSKGGG